MSKITVTQGQALNYIEDFVLIKYNDPKPSPRQKLVTIRVKLSMQNKNKDFQDLVSVLGLPLILALAIHLAIKRYLL